MLKFPIGAMGLALLLGGLGCEPTAVPPQNSAAYQQAQRALVARDHLAAVAAYHLVLEQYPRFARAHLELGLLADEKMADPITAIYHYRRGLELEPSADRRRIIEDYIERAKLALAARLPKPEGLDTTELIRLQNQNATLMRELLALRSKLAELEAAAVPLAREPLLSNAVVVAPPPSPSPVISNTHVVLAPVAAPARPAYHEVARGDTLSLLALRYYGSRAAWEKIYRANQEQLTNKDQLRIGQRLVLP